MKTYLSILLSNSVKHVTRIYSQLKIKPKQLKFCNLPTSTSLGCYYIIQLNFIIAHIYKGQKTSQVDIPIFPWEAILMQCCFCLPVLHRHLHKLSYTLLGPTDHYHDWSRCETPANIFDHKIIYTYPINTHISQNLNCRNLQ